MTRDEVTTERRPISDPANTQPSGEGEIRIPLMEEQLVVEKRMVPVERSIVRKSQVTNSQTVEADLRKERLVTDGIDQQTGTSASSRTAR